MGRRKANNAGGGIGAAILLLICMVLAAIKAAIQFMAEHIVMTVLVICVMLAAIIAILVWKSKVKKQRKELLEEILQTLHLENIDNILLKYDDEIIVKSKQALDNYDIIKYLKETNLSDEVREIAESKYAINKTLSDFLRENEFKDRPQYQYVENQLKEYLDDADGYRLHVVYITAAGNKKGSKRIRLDAMQMREIDNHPELLMTKGEYNKMLKQQEKEELDSKKHALYDEVNTIVDFANETKEKLIVKKQGKKLDELVQNLFDRTVNSIQKIKSLDSDEWGLIQKIISDTDTQVKSIASEDRKIREYYESDEFEKIKQTCDLLTQSRKEFNEYINEKANAITELFGTRVVRNETQNEDTYNYIRAYKKSVTPFTAEVSSTVFASAENNPMGYIVKYFYPNKSQYKTQIGKLRILIEELETLKEAKDIIDNYKKDYDQYIQNVPQYVLDNDEDGFYSRLGLAIIDESVLNVEYKFVYTSGGGMAQRSFTVPMNEENITELINQLESKLSLEALAKEQRALMTSKLRTQIKERDHYTCCQCGNSVEAEPNLLLEIDHIIPVSKGGLTVEDNLQTLCWKCNRNKGAKILSN